MHTDACGGHHLHGCTGDIPAYATIADEVVRGVVETSLPVLTREVKQLLKKDSDRF